MQLLLAALLNIVLASLKRFLIPVFDREAELAAKEGGELGQTMAAVVSRKRVLAFKTFEFLQAWALWDIIKSLWAGFGWSPCHATNLAAMNDGIVPKSLAWVPTLTATIVLVNLAAAQAARPPISQRNARIFQRAADSYARPGCQETVELGLGIIENTIAVQLGWASKAFFDALSPSDALKVTIAIMFVATVGLAPVAYACFAHCYPDALEERSVREKEAANAATVPADVQPAAISAELGGAGGLIEGDGDFVL
eukprot:5112511-Prymnesium_polylepis.1